MARTPANESRQTPSEPSGAPEAPEQAQHALTRDLLTIAASMALSAQRAEAAAARAEAAALRAEGVLADLRAERETLEACRADMVQAAQNVAKGLVLSGFRKVLVGYDGGRTDAA